MIYYHRGISGRIRFVTIEQKKGSATTVEPLPMTLDDSVRPASDLIGKLVELDGVFGRIIRPLSTSSRLLKGKYIGQKRWLHRRDMAQFNHFVIVKWDNPNCKLSTRQPLFNLKIV